MIITNQTYVDYWFGPMHLPGGVGQTLDLDDTSDTSLYLLNDEVADAVNTLHLASNILVTSYATPFPRPTGVPSLLHGDGSPEGMVYAPPGSLYMRRDTTSAATALYSKTSGITQNIGWIGVLAPTMEAIGQISLSSSEPSISFDDIPQTSTNLQLICALGSDQDTYQPLYCTANGGGGEAHWDTVYAQNGTAFAAEGTATPFQIGNVASFGTYSFMGATVMTICSYAKSGMIAPWVSTSGMVDSSAGIAGTFGGSINANPVTSLQIQPYGGNFVAGSVATLYGL